MNQTQASAQKSGLNKLGDRIWTLICALLLGGLFVGIAGNYVGSSTMECTVTGAHVTINNKRGSGMSNQGRTIETEQCGELRWGARSFGSDGASAEELEKNHPELVKGETYVFQVQGFRFPIASKSSIVGIEES